MELAVLIYRLTQEFPREETFGLRSQLRRAAVSIPSNIAESQGRLNTREFRQFPGIARGSICEPQTQFQIAGAMGFGDPRLLGEAEAFSNRIGTLLSKLLSALKSKLPSL